MVSWEKRTCSTWPAASSASTPEERGKYRVENTALQWDADFGPEAAEPAVALHNFEFRFSGKPEVDSRSE